MSNSAPFSIRVEGPSPQAFAPSMFARLGLDPRTFFHPGHYGNGAGRNPIPSSWLGLPNACGVVLNFRWGDLESGSPGNYDFTQIDERLAQCIDAGQQLIIRVQKSHFGSGNPETPDYMWNDASYGGDPAFYGNWPKNSQEGWRPYIESAKVTDRLVSLYQEIGARYGAEANVEALNVSESALDQVQDDLAVDTHMKQAYLAARDAMAGKGYATATINFAPWAAKHRDTNESPEWNLCLYCIENDIGLAAPDLKEDNALLNNGAFKAMRDNHLEVPIHVEVQWANYDPPQNTDKTVEEILAFGNGIAHGVVTASRAALSPRNWIHAWDYSRQPWFSGAPTTPVAGSNVQEVMSSRACTLAEAFYDSIGAGQYDGDGWP